MNYTGQNILALNAPFKLIVSDVEETPATVDVPLNFAANLRSTVDPLERVFQDSSGPTTVFTITGTCTSSKGDITLSGLGLSARTTASCDANNTFSKQVYYSSGAVTFSADFGGKVISASQAGSTTVTTTIFKAATTHTTIELIEDAADLAAMQLTADSYYILVNDIDLAAEVGAVNNWSSLAPTSGAVSFAGVFEGNGKTISNLNSSGANGLFDLVNGSSTSPATISNVRLTNASISCSGGDCGILAGTGGQYSSIFHGYVTGSISGTTLIGGVAGYTDGKIFASFANVTATGTTGVGGLVGGTGSQAVVSQSYSAGTIQATVGTVGGFGGVNTGTMTDNYTSANVVGTSAARVGGFIGKISVSGIVNRCAAFGSVSATGSTLSGPAAGVDNASTGATAIIYNSSSTCTACTNTLFTGKTTAELKTKTTYTAFSWDFSSLPIWTIDDGTASPKFSWE